MNRSFVRCLEVLSKFLERDSLRNGAAVLGLVFYVP